MKLLAMLAALLVSTTLFAGTTATITPGDWPLYRGSTILGRYASQDACAAAAKALNVARSYTCRTSTGVAIAVTVDPPPLTPVDCVVSDFTQGPLVPPTCPVSGQQTRTDSRTVVTPASNGGAACPTLTQTVNVGCVPPVVTPPPVTSGSWEERSTGPGVVDATSFEGSAPPNCNGNWPGPSKDCYEASGAYHLAMDKAQHASGSQSLRLDYAGSGDNPTGDYWRSWPRTFGQNSHFYVQYRMRLHGLVSSSAPWKSPSVGGEGWKTSLFAGPAGPLCGNIELSTVNFYYENKFRLYTRCSNSQYDNFEFTDGAGGFNQQQGDFACKYEDSNPQAHCAMFHGDTWMTLYYDVQIGTWGVKNSTIKAYVDYCDGKGMKQWINAPNYQLDGPGAYGLTDFTLYTTKKNDSSPGTAAGYAAWYDDYILSTQPIAPAGCL